MPLMSKMFKKAAAPRPALAPPPKPAPKPTPAPVPAAPQGLVRAFLVGINYVGTPYELRGCIADVLNVQTQINTFFPTCKDIRIYSDNTATKPTRANILAGLSWLLTGLKPGQNVMFHYSGHGGLIVDKNGDEVSGYDGCLYPINNSRLETIIDDEIRAVIVAANIPAGCKCFFVVDACHSGTSVDLRYTWKPVSRNSMTFTEDTKYAGIASSVVLLSGCRDDQKAADTVDKNNRPCGALTNAYLSLWKTYGPAIKMKSLLWDVRANLSANGYTQVPQLSTGYPMDPEAVYDLSK